MINMCEVTAQLVGYFLWTTRFIENDCTCYELCVLQEMQVRVLLDILHMGSETSRSWSRLTKWLHSQSLFMSYL